MRPIARRFRDFTLGEDGPTAVEYAVMLALILLACFAAVSAFGSGVGGSMSTTVSKINAVLP